MKELFRHYALFSVGLYFLSMGIVLIVRSLLGTTPISSVNYVLSLNTPFSLGVCTFFVNMTLVAGQFWLIRGRSTRHDIVNILLQIPFSFLFSAFIDFNMWITAGIMPAHYGVSLLLLAVGCLTQAVGVVLELKPRVVMMSAEGLVYYASSRYGKDFGHVKVWLDVTLVVLAVLLSLLCKGRIEGVREGSVIAACITGYIVSFLNARVLTRDVLDRILNVVKR